MLCSEEWLLERYTWAQEKWLVLESWTGQGRHCIFLNACKLIWLLEKLKFSFQLTYLKKAACFQSDVWWEWRKAQRWKFGVVGTYLTISQNLLIMPQKALTVGQQCLRFTVIWYFALGYFFQERRKFLCVSSEGTAHAEWWIKTEQLMASHSMISEALNLRIHYYFLNASWSWSSFKPKW